VRIRDEMNLDTLIIGNGDITDFEDAISKAKDYEVDGVMIGRGVFADPWIFAEKRLSTRDPKINENISATKHTRQECLDLLLKHTKLFVNTWGEEKPFALMKKFFKIYVRDFEGANELRQKLMECDSVTEVEIAIKNYK
jgi:tRNA-dihydrouridine synthase